MTYLLRLAAASIPLAWTATAASAPPVPQAAPTGQALTLAGTAATSSGVPIHTIATGDLDGDHVPDVVWEAPSLLGISMAPSFADAPLDGPAGATSIAIVPRDGVFHHVDTLYFTSPDGLQRAHYDASDPHGIEWVETIVAGGAWANSSHLMAVELDGDADVDLIALNHDRTGVLVARNTPGGFLAFDYPLVTTQGQIDDLQAVHLGLEGAAPIVLSTVHGLEVYRLGYGLHRKISLADPEGRLAILDRGASPRIAWLRNRGTSGRTLSLLDGDLNETRSIPMPDSASTLGAGRYNNNASDDLAITFSGGQRIELRVDPRTPAGPPAAKVIECSAEPINAELRPFIGDLDGDGDGDAGLAISTSQSLFVFLNDQISHEEATPKILTDSENKRHLWIDNSGTTERLYMRFVHYPAPAPDSSLAEPHGPDDADAIQVFLWSSLQVSPSVSYRTLDQPAVVTIRTDDPTSSFPGEGTFWDVALDIFTGTESDRDLRYLSYRYVALSADGSNITRAWPMAQIYIAGLQNTSGLAYAEDLPFTAPATGIPTLDPFIDAGAGGTAGSGGPTRCCPDFPTGCPPRTGPTTTGG